MPGPGQGDEVINGMGDDSDVQMDNENVVSGEEAAEGVAGLHAGDGEVRQERVVVSKNADMMIYVAIVVASEFSGVFQGCIFD